MGIIHYKNIREITGDILKISIPQAENHVVSPRLDDLALIHTPEGTTLLAQIINLQKQIASLQVFGSTKGLSTDSSVSLLGHPMRVSYSYNILGRVFNGIGKPIDGGPTLEQEDTTPIRTSTVNPTRRVLASKMIRTNIPMIDLFNCLVESQKIPIFSIAGEPYNELLAKIATQADADIIIFGGMGLLFDDYYAFRKTFEDYGSIARTVMFVNQASDPILERLLVPDMALAVAEKMAVEEGKRVLVLLTDMTAFADALKEVGIAMERIPSNRGYMGDLYSQLARRYEKACDFQGAGSVTILSVTTMPGNDLTHPVPDNTGYITEGQLYLHAGSIDPFGSLSRLKQHVIGKQTRDDHGQIMNAMIRFFSAACEAEQKQAMAFEITEYDERLLKFGRLFRERFMDIKVSLPLEKALDLSWKTLGECFQENELLIKQELIAKYFKVQVPGEGNDASQTE
ncbi:V-type ATPase subunit B [Legionella quinlivanii]|uniref:V-type ATPase subunit B n=1 Tax=Legionella quinlivanii TaxID=45073 RepID=A0A0W0XLA3_9GAMM|nr:V-type ATP synthase subunit B [Legionella quinlivanii]KTD45251.1 V-type ATPase subunit B [Legionella quinlivanii]MCW8450374.1 V-type ATP synthase subunit B [Legionella quinlivanii]SEG03814.1 V/A-type H+-transporting ATPase subunit B [Legionella quinlivanii DSM 21216]STY11449.1 V-type ATPase subunit B [Legionella quinlivanii]